MLLQLFIDIIGVNTFMIYSNFFRKINLLKLRAHLGGLARAAAPLLEP
jgi:hypothetical protein